MALCLITGIAGISAAYENTRRIGFGEYTKAVEIHDGKIKILDFEIDLINRLPLMREACFAQFF